MAKLLEIFFVALVIITVFGFPEKSDHMSQNINCPQKQNLKEVDLIQKQTTKDNHPRTARDVEHDDSNENSAETIKLIPADSKESQEYNLPEGNNKEDQDDNLDYGLPTDVKIKYQ